MRKCGKCLSYKNIGEFTFSSKKQQFHYACRDCVKIINRRYYLDNSKKVKDQVRSYREKNLEKVLLASSVANKARYRALRMAALLAYGAECMCCGERGLEFLCIDHVRNDGKKHREQIKNVTFGVYRWLKDNDYPKNDFQLLCHNCNFSKYANGGTCVHQSPEGSTTIPKGSTAKQPEVRDALRGDDIV